MTEPAPILAELLAIPHRATERTRLLDKPHGTPNLAMAANRPPPFHGSALQPTAIPQTPTPCHPLPRSAGGPGRRR